MGPIFISSNCILSVVSYRPCLNESMVMIAFPGLFYRRAAWSPARFAHKTIAVPGRQPSEVRVAEMVVGLIGRDAGEHTTAEERFSAAAERMRSRDAVDREEVAELRR